MTASDTSEGYRSWQPGDGMRCSLANRAAEGFPCGPPVLTQVKQHVAVGRKTAMKTTVICKNHVASRFIPGGLGVINAQAERKAREAVLASHWDEYQEARRAARETLSADLLAGVPEEFRSMVAAGLTAHGEDDSLGGSS